MSFDHRPIDAPCAVDADLLRQIDVRGIVLGHHHKPRGILIQPVDDAGAHLAPDARKIIAGEQQRIDQRVLLMPRRGMHHQRARLIDHHNVRILVDDGDVHLHRHGLQRFRVGQRQFDLVARGELLPRFAGRFAVAPDAAVLDEVLDA